ncbi:MAG TPA: cytochrome b/b6 domain-containing protein [Anaerolineaceae bacterium]
MSAKEKTYDRFSIFQRIEHLVLVISFTTLAVTGLVQKFNDSSISLFLISVLGGIEATRIIHRIAASIMVIETLYHLVVIGYKLFVMREKASMIPEIKDLKDAIQLFLFNIGVAKKRPHMPRYNFAEKAEYWAMIWGTAVMGLTGFILWNPIAVAKVLPGVIIPASKTAHGMEAILAAAAIVLWHFYNVHLKRLNMSMINGKLTHSEMEEEHMAELEMLEKEPAKAKPTPVEWRSRMKIFVPVSSVTCIALLAGFIWFITLEDTALTTVPPLPKQPAVYVPQTPTPLPTLRPTPTPMPTATPAPSPTPAPTQPGAIAQPTPTRAAMAAPSWDSEIGALFKSRCVACHGTMGGLSLASYAEMMKGGSKGPAVIAKDPQGGSLVPLMEKGGHAVNFEPAELEKIKAWILAGAPEK